MADVWKQCDSRIGAYGLVVDDHGRLLAARQAAGAASAGEWTLPGGEIELGESAEAAAVRELEEETGYTVELDELLAVDIEYKAPGQRSDRSDRHYRFVRVIFRARVAGGRLRAEAAGTTDLARWFTPAELAEAPHVTLVDVALEALTADMPSSKAGADRSR